MTLNESVVEPASLEWSERHRRVGPPLTPALSQGGRESDEDEVLLARFGATPQQTSPVQSPLARGLRTAERRLSP